MLVCEAAGEAPCGRLAPRIPATKTPAAHTLLQLDKKDFNPHPSHGDQTSSDWRDRWALFT